MKTTVKYVVLKGDDHQLGTPLHEEQLDAPADFFDKIPDQLTLNQRNFRLKYKELNRKYSHYDEIEEAQHIVVKLIAI